MNRLFGKCDDVDSKNIHIRFINGDRADLKFTKLKKTKRNLIIWKRDNDGNKIKVTLPMTSISWYKEWCKI